MPPYCCNNYCSQSRIFIAAHTLIGIIDSFQCRLQHYYDTHLTFTASCCNKLQRSLSHCSALRLLQRPFMQMFKCCNLSYRYFFIYVLQQAQIIVATKIFISLPPVACCNTIMQKFFATLANYRASAAQATLLPLPQVQVVATVLPWRSISFITWLSIPLPKAVATVVLQLATVHYTSAWCLLHMFQLRITSGCCNSNAATCHCHILPRPSVSFITWFSICLLHHVIQLCL